MTLEGETTEMQAASTPTFPQGRATRHAAWFPGAFCATKPCCCSNCVSIAPANSSRSAPVPASSKRKAALYHVIAYPAKTSFVDLAENAFALEEMLRCASPHLRLGRIRELTNDFCIPCVMFDEAEMSSRSECDQSRP